MASKGAILQGMIERLALNVLTRLSFDSTSRLLVTAGVTGTLTTVTTVTNLTNVGGVTAASRLQVDSQDQYSLGFRSNLVVT